MADAKRVEPAAGELTPRPLAGRRVLVTRPQGQAGGLAGRLEALGAETIICPTVRIAPPEDPAPLDAAIEGLAGFDWIIFTSVNGVRFFLERLAALGRGAQALQNVRLAAIGPATARALAGAGAPVAFVPGEYVAEAIVDGIGDVTGQRILLPRADIARKALADGLAAKGAQVREVVAYRTVAVEGALLPDLLGGAHSLDIATFTSPSTVRSFVALAGEDALARMRGRTLIACIGPITARAAAEEGLAAHIVAAEHTVEGLIQAIVEYLEKGSEWQ